jgi:3-hydroxyacyl-CoA dehydrogenase
MIRTAAVLGAGTMGAQLAAHLANAGLDVVLFDLSTAVAETGLGRLAGLSPPALFTPDTIGRIRPAGFDDLRLAGAADWVVEAVVESLPVKRDLVARLEPYVNPQAAVSSNTSAIPVHEIAAECGEAFRRRWLGTHFFNPPRYQPLVELVPTPETDPSVVAALDAFLDRSLGKHVVIALDTPGFIANRVGLFGAVRALELWASGEFALEDIEAATGPLVGGPPSATFRTIDLVGLDVVAAVAADLARRLPGEGYELPARVHEMAARGLVGTKTGRGFYKRAAPGEKRFLVLDPATLDYRDAVRPDAAFAATGAIGERVRRFLADDSRAGDLVRRVTGAMLLHTASIAPEIASSLDDVDRAMRWGFGWELGPFELWDAAGMSVVLEAMRPQRRPEVVQSALARGRTTLREGPLRPARPDLQVITSARRAGGVVRSLAEASLVDLGDGVFCVELHSRKNVLGQDALVMIHAGISHAAARGSALVVSSEATPFSVGADLRLVLAAAEAGRWTDLDAMVRAFQDAMMAIKTAPVPVVAAPAGLTLGGGCELCLHAARIEAAAETYIGLSETSLGLIPAGGGTKEMLLRAVEAADPAAATAAIFRTLAMARVSTSARDAQRLGYLRAGDGITMHRERVAAAARAAALADAKAFQPRAELDAIPVGGARLHDRLVDGIEDALRAGSITDHDATVGRALARVFTGAGAGGALAERQLLDLEREAFLRLCGERKTVERIAYTLKTGQPLRN